MDTPSSTTSSFSIYVIAAIILIFLFIILMIYSFYADTEYSYVILGIAILFLLIGLFLLFYFYFFVRVPDNSGNTNNNNSTNPNGPSGPTGMQINYGDSIQLFNIQSSQFASPCDSNNCGSFVSMRTNDSFNQNNGVSTNLRKWVIKGVNIADGQPVRYNQSIILISQYTPLNNQPISICALRDGPVAVTIGSNFANGTQMWTVLRDPNDHQAGDIITNNSRVNFRNNVFNIEGLPTYLSVCVNRDDDFCAETSAGCGIQVIATDVINSNQGVTPAQAWAVQKL